MSSVVVIVQNHKHNIIRPVAFLSKVIESKAQELKKTGTDGNITLEEISNELFEKFIELGNIYYGMDDSEKKEFINNTNVYIKNNNKSQHVQWMDEIYSDLSNEQIFGLMCTAEKLKIKFLICLLGHKLSKFISLGDEDLDGMFE
jgi:hypothetical protein